MLGTAEKEDYTVCLTFDTFQILKHVNVFTILKVNLNLKIFQHSIRKMFKCPEKLKEFY